MQAAKQEESDSSGSGFPVSKDDVVVAEYSGTGIQSTRPFTVDGPWEVQWSSESSYLSIMLKNSGEKDGFPNIIANQQGSGPGSSYQPQGGTYYFQTNAMGTWHMKVEADEKRRPTSQRALEWMPEPTLSVPADQPAGAASGMETAPAVSDDALAAKPAPTGQSKQWGTVLVTLKDYSVRGGVVSVVLLMKNESDKEEPISSLLFFEALSEEGDRGENDWTNNHCDGTIPPNGVFKCQLGFTFSDAPKEVSLRVGAGFLAKAVYFNLTAPIPLAAR